MNDPNPKPIYLEMDERIDRMAYWTWVISAKMTFPVTVSTNLLLTGINYFILDLGEDSYFLPFPILYVLQSELNQ